MQWKFRADDATLAVGARAEFIRFMEAQHASPDDCFRAELVFGELIGNVVRHAPGPISIAFQWKGAQAKLSVSDIGPGFSLSNEPVSEDAESGRGLMIVRSLVKKLNVTRTAGGSHVTASLQMTHAFPELSRQDARSMRATNRVTTLV